MSKKQQRYMTKGHYIDEKCPQCGMDLIGNDLGEKWCGYLTCNYGLIDLTEEGADVSVEKKMSITELKKEGVSADDVLKDAVGELQDVLIIGWGSNGEQFISGNVNRADELIWLLETCKATIMEQYVETS